MERAACPDVLVYVCQNCVPDGGDLPRQWTQGDMRVLVRYVPCSGKTDAQYLFHALEGGCQGLCVVTCPKAACHLAEGNYRAEMRVRTIQHLLAEIGLDPRRVQLLASSFDDPPELLEQAARQAVGAIREAVGGGGYGPDLIRTARAPGAVRSRRTRPTALGETDRHAPKTRKR